MRIFLALWFLLLLAEQIHIHRHIKQLDAQVNQLRLDIAALRVQ